MANRSYLYNTATPRNNPYDLFAGLDQPGGEFVEIAAIRERIPIPWCLCFASKDLFPFQLQYEDADGKAAILDLECPCCTVSSALLGLKKALPHFQQLAQDAELGRGYWQRAIDALSDLPYKFLTINAIEMIVTHPDYQLTAFAAAASGDIEALKGISGLCGEPPYPSGMVAEKGNHSDLDVFRVESSLALSGGFHAPDDRRWFHSPLDRPDAIILQTPENLRVALPQGRNLVDRRR